MSKRVIWWFPVEPREFVLDLPPAQVLTVRLRDDKPVVYVEVDPDAPTIPHRFVTVMTGEEYEPPFGQWDYIGTVQIGWVVAHLFFAGVGA